METEKCVFCEALIEGSRVVFTTQSFFIIYDQYPVNRGHILIIPKRHVPDVFLLDNFEWEILGYTLDRAKEYLDNKFHPDAYNIGINCGETAGQTVMHAHIHIIPRYNGDVENPRGGIRNFKKPLVEY